MYLNLIQLADSFGVSEKVVEDWVRDEGLPHVVDRGRLLFDRARVVDWAAAHGLTVRAGFLASENGAFTSGLALAPMLQAGGIWRNLPSTQTVVTFERIISNLPAVTPAVRNLLCQRLKAKGGINWAPVGDGFALPHFSTRVTLGRETGIVALILLGDSLTLSEPLPDETPVTQLIFFVPPSPRAHIDMLARLSRAIAQGPLVQLVKRKATDEEILRAISAMDEAKTTAARRKELS